MLGINYFGNLFLTLSLTLTLLCFELESEHVFVTVIVIGGVFASLNFSLLI